MIGNDSARTALTDLFTYSLTLQSRVTSIKIISLSDSFDRAIPLTLPQSTTCTSNQMIRTTRQLQVVRDQHTRKLPNQRSKYITQVQQQRPETPTVTLTSGMRVNTGSVVRGLKSHYAIIANVMIISSSGSWSVTVMVSRVSWQLSQLWPRWVP